MAKSESFVRLEHSEDIDRISSLPNPLLSHILSLLPTKYAVATSILSTRWRFVWTSITNLNFNDNDVQVSHCIGYSYDMRRKNFTQFVNRVLLLLNPPCIQNFRLKCRQNHCDTSYLNSWVCAAMGRTVHELDLDLKLDKPMGLPLSHFYGKTLITVLKLSGSIHFNIAASASICFPNLSTFHISKILVTIASNCSVSFPSLKDLLLDSVKYWNEESVRNLIASCPVLDNLDLQLNQSREFPFSHFYCKTLTVLKLSGAIHFNIAASASSICFPNLSTFHISKITFAIASNCSVSFPSLKDLLLDSVKYVNEESVHKLFASCPVLDNLVINRSHWDNVLCLIIFIPSLRSLKCSGFFQRRPEGHGNKLQIDTPALKYLYLEDSFMCEYFTADNLSSLLEARINSDFKGSLTIDANSYNISIFKFIGGLVNVKFLSISGGILKAISSISANIGPFFPNLMQLELGIDSCRDWSAVIKNWLENSDNLEHLAMKGSSCRGSHESWWMEPVLVPMCLQRGVTTISYTAMTGECSDELELVRYFLKNGKVLQLLTVDSLGGSDAEKLKMMQKISMMPRGSQACQVAFK